MTVTNPSNKVEENGNGIKTNFQFEFELKDDSHLIVYKYDILSKDAVLQTEGIDYIIPVRALGQVGGSVEYTIAPTTEERSILIRELPITQETSIPVASNLPERALENGYDNLTMISQQLDERLNRTFKSAIGTNPGDIDFTLPALSAKKAFIVDETGTKIILSDDDYNDQLANVTAQADSAEQSAQNASAEVSRAQAFADDASTSATNAQTAETNAQNSATNAQTAETNAQNSASNASTSETNAGLARDEAVTAKDDAETAQTGAEQAEQNVIDLLDQFPDLVPTDTGKFGTVNEAGDGYDLLPSGVAGQVLTSNGANTKPEYKNAPATVNVTDNLLSTSPTDALSANQGRVLKGLVDGNTVSISNNASNISSNFSSIVTLNDDIFAVDTKVDNNTTRITTAETNIFNNSQDIATNTSDITANKQILDKIPVTNPTDTGRLAIVNSTGDAFELLGTGATGQVLTSAGGNAIPSFQNASGGTVIIDNLTSTSAVDALSANQGRVLKGITDTNASAITANTDLIDRIPSTTIQDTGKLLAVDPNGVEFDLLNTGTSGQVLTSGGTNTTPSFQDPPSGVGFAVNKIEVTQDFTVTLDLFEGGFDIVFLDLLTASTITIDGNYANYEDVVGKTIIIQDSRDFIHPIIFSGFTSVTGYRTGNYDLRNYTRSIFTLCSKPSNQKYIFVDDQQIYRDTYGNNAKISYLPTSPAGRRGELFVINEDATAYDSIGEQGNVGDVLTSRGSNLLPEFAPATAPGTEKVKVFKPSVNTTYNLSALEPDFDVLYIQSFDDALITIDADYPNYQDILGKTVIVQVMDDNYISLTLDNFDIITGYQTGSSFTVPPYTRVTLSILTKEDRASRVVYVDDQQSLTQIKTNKSKLDKYINPSTTVAGRVMAISENGTTASVLSDQGTAGRVLTSNGTGLLPSFQPLSGAGGYQLLSSIDFDANPTNIVDFLLEDFNDEKSTFVIIFSDVASSSTSAKLLAKLSDDGGQTFRSFSDGYNWLLEYSISSSNNVTIDFDKTDSFLQLTQTAKVTNAVIYVYAPGNFSATRMTCSYMNHAGETSSIIMGTSAANSTDIASDNAIRFQPGNGNFSTGRATLFRLITR